MAFQAELVFGICTQDALLGSPPSASPRLSQRSRDAEGRRDGELVSLALNRAEAVALKDRKGVDGSGKLAAWVVRTGLGAPGRGRAGRKWGANGRKSGRRGSGVAGGETGGTAGPGRPGLTTVFDRLRLYERHREHRERHRKDGQCLL